MALEFKIIDAKLTSGGFHATAPRAVEETANITFSVQAFDPARPEVGDGQLLPVEVSDLVILELEGLPIVNFDTFQFQDTYAGSAWLIQPWLICTSKRVTRDGGNGLVFRVSCDFRTYSQFQIKETDLYLIGANPSIDNLPFLIERVWTGEERIIYEEPDKAKPLRLPTGTLFSQPFRRLFPKKNWRQLQFEDFVDDAACFAAIEDRLFTTNAATFDNDPVSDPADPPRWIITDIQYQQVRVRADANNFIEPYLMTYTIDREARDGGQFDRRALVDKSILTVANDLTTRDSYRDPTNSSSVIDALLARDGTLLPDQTGDPEFVDYQVQPSLDWSFLKT